MNTKTILVVEDDADISSLLRFSLKTPVFRSLNPQARGCDEILTEEQTDLVIIDWMLPGDGRLKPHETLRKRTDTEKIPIIMLTARSEEADAIRGFDSGSMTT
ncbi:MAG: hypothetical protein Ct9H300mP8_09760 [Gammaproteobacteria bacterium]|nr:MAG: hypothetical protein Ct9H300mP8_09760 [Gammaproteobacteria bacterium]